MLGLIAGEEFRSRLSREPVPPGHFYSVIPGEREIRAQLENPRVEDPMLGIELNLEAQRRLMERLESHCRDLPFGPEPRDGLRYHFVNPAFSWGDGITLFGMVQEARPKRIVEVGSGFSSALMMDLNDLRFERRIDITFIEPHPKLLFEMMMPGDRERYTVLESGIQEVDLEHFTKLGENDILFIDSTHVSKLSSDVNRIVFEILPSLAKGVLVHFHDIFWPFEYPPEWTAEGRAWNEAYLLRAFLQFNSHFEILFFSDLMFIMHREWVTERAPEVFANPGAGLWLRKTR